MGTEGDFVRRSIAGLLAVGALMVCLASGASASVELGGSFRVDLEVSETEPPALARLGATIAIFGEAWRTTGRLTVTDGEFTAFDVTDERTFGPFRLRSVCVFDPDVGFSYLGSTARFVLFDVQMGNYVFLSQDPALSYDQLTARWTGGDVSLSVVWRSGLCPVEFRSAQVVGQWYVASCDLFMDVRSAFTGSDGFDYLRATGRFPRVPFLSGDVIETELQLGVQFETDRMSFSSSLRIRAGKINACMTPYVQLLDGASPLEVEGIEVYGWTVECSVAGFVDLLMATSLDPARNRELTGEADYWEAWKLRGAAPGCCGRDLAWELAVYFEEGGDSLFDCGRTIVAAEIPVGERLTARFGAEFSAASPHWVLDAGLEVRF